MKKAFSFVKSRPCLRLLEAVHLPTIVKQSKSPGHQPSHIRLDLGKNPVAHVEATTVHNLTGLLALESLEADGGHETAKLLLEVNGPCALSTSQKCFSRASLLRACWFSMGMDLGGLN